MPLTEAHLVPLLIALAALAVALGLLANFVAVRLLLERNDAANDATFNHAKIAHRSRRAAARGALRLVARQTSGKPARGRPYFPELARQSARRPLLKRVP